MKQIVKLSGENFNELKEEVLSIKERISAIENNILSFLYFSEEYDRFRNIQGSDLVFLSRLATMTQNYHDLIESAINDLDIQIGYYVSLINQIPHEYQGDDKRTFEFPKVVMVSEDVAVVCDEELPPIETLKLGVNFNIHLLNKEQIHTALFDAARNRYRNYTSMDRIKY